MTTILVILCGLALLAGCGGETDGEAVADANRATSAEIREAATTAQAGDATDGLLHGEVIETMDAASYTYARVATDEGEIWAAAPQTELAVGDEVVFEPGMVMTDFESRSLGRTWERIRFVSAFRREGDVAANSPAEHAARPASGGHGRARVDASGADIDVRPAEGGQTVADLYALGDGAAGAEVLLRAQVVKANLGIMGTNWYHVQDGSGRDGAADLTVTSDARLEVGDVVLVKGTLATDRDFGAGYRYDLIVEDAEVVVDAL